MEASSSRSSSNSQLCQLCLKLAEQDLDFLLTGSAQFSREIVHHLSYADLTQSVRSGCPLCAIFQNATFQHKRSNDSNEAREERRLTAAGRETAFRIFANFGKLRGEDIFAAHVLSLRYGRVTTANESNAWFKGHGSSSGSAYGNPKIDRSQLSDEYGVLPVIQGINLDSLYFSYPTGKSGPPRKDEKYENAGEIHMAVVEGCHEYPIKRRAISPCIEYDVAAEWLQSCSTTHHTCRPSEICDLPTRVVEISTDIFPPKLRLLETRGKKGQYVTLTHCWGLEAIAAKTLKENQADYQKDICFEELPRNFKDGIAVTQALGFEYIWIDSLCIIQNSVEDWEFECSRMAAIFVNSVLTIAGSAAGFANHGFLHPRPQSSSSIQVDLMRETSLTGTVMLDAFDNWGMQTAKEPDSPLIKRGWILQERLLSPRILYLGSRQMYFECNSSERYESFPTSTIPASDPPNDFVHGAESLRKNVLDTVSPQSVYALWYSIVVACSACQLTNGDDRLPSLSGLATRFQSRLKRDEYLAGIWRGDMIHGLLWYRKYPEAQPQSVNAPRTGAPSWSWVSCNRPVRFYVDHWNGWLNGYQWKSFVKEIKTLHISARPTGQDRFGCVERGTWKVQGRMRECILRHLQNSDGSSNWFVCRSEDNQPLSWFLPDRGEFDNEGTSPHSGIHALSLGQKPDAIRSDPVRYALLLQSVGEQPSTFRRIGITSLGYHREHLAAKEECFAWLEKGDRFTIDIL